MTNEEEINNKIIIDGFAKLVTLKDDKFDKEKEIEIANISKAIRNLPEEHIYFIIAGIIKKERERKYTLLGKKRRNDVEYHNRIAAINMKTFLLKITLGFAGTIFFVTYVYALLKRIDVEEITGKSLIDIIKLIVTTIL